MKQILIIEDDPLIADIYKDKLQSEGFAVRLAANGRSGLAAFNGEQPDLVLLDLMLPEANGVEVLREIRSRFTPQQLPVVVFTNAYFGGMIQQAWEGGANQVVTKATMTPRILAQIIRNTLDPSPSATTVKSLGVKPRNGEEIFDAEVREELLEGAPTNLAMLWQPLKLLVTQPTHPTALKELAQRIYPLTAKAALAGWLPISHMSAALEAFLKDLREKPDRLTPSAILTIAQGIDTLQFLFERHPHLKLTNLSAARILMVDDDEFARQAVQSALEKVGLRATCVDHPVSALKRRRGQHFDLIFLDVELPEASGFDLCTRLRNAAAHQRTPIVFLTMHDTDHDRMESVLCGGDDFITKPFLFTELGVKALSFIIRGRHQFDRTARGRNGHGARSAMFSRRDLNALKQALLDPWVRRSR